MADKKGRGTRRSDRPAAAAALKEKRDAFLHTFFKRGAELTDEVVHDNHRLRDQVVTLEAENLRLKTQLASDRAIRDLLKKIDELEREKALLLSTVMEKEEITGKITNRFAEVESELESFANLYVASFQLHVHLGVRTVLRHVKELLQQLIGARSSALYFLHVEKRTLEVLMSDGIDPGGARPIVLESDEASTPVEAVVERVFLTGVAHIADGPSPTPPAACVPLMMDERAVGVIVVYELLEQKKRFVTVDRELFKLLGAHAATAIVGSYHFVASGDRIPTPEELRAISS
jgi:hypothetical protein